MTYKADNRVIRLALADIAAINRIPMRKHVDDIGRDQKAGIWADVRGLWSWYGYASESHGFESKADAARDYVATFGIGA